jgi:hypothetical protein
MKYSLKSNWTIGRLARKNFREFFKILDDFVRPIESGWKFDAKPAHVPPAVWSAKPHHPTPRAVKELLFHGARSFKRLDEDLPGHPSVPEVGLHVGLSAALAYRQRIEFGYESSVWRQQPRHVIILDY